MQVQVVFRGMESSEAVENYVAKHVEKLNKYFAKENPDTIAVQVVLESQHHHQLMHVEVHIKTNHFSAHAKREGRDMYSLIDETMHIIDQDLAKKKDRMIDEVKHRKKCC